MSVPAGYRTYFLIGGAEPGGPELRAFPSRRRPWLLMPAALFTLLIFPVGVATASVATTGSIGVGIQAGPVRLGPGAHPGGTYQLPGVYVVNTGTQDESVTLKIQRISPGNGRTVPPSWIHVNSGPVHLGHRQSATIPLQLSVPPNAKPGKYFSDVVAHGSSTLSAGHANLGVAAATGLNFTVVPGAAPHPFLVIPGWFWPGLGGLVVVAAAILWIFSSGLRIRVERKPAPGGMSEGQGHADIA